MEVKGFFRFSTSSSDVSTFQAHNHFIFSTEKPAFFQHRYHKSVSFPSIKKRKPHFIISRAKNIVCEVLEVTDETWKELIIDSEIPVIVQFWAPSCGPCKVVEPVVIDLIKEYAGKVLFYKINTDDCLKMASQYAVKSIPTVLIFKDGKQKACITGAVRKNSLSAMLEKYL